MASLSQINILFRANLSQFSSEMQNAKRQLEKSGKEFQSIGKSLSMALTLPLLAGGAAAIKFGSDYQESLNKVDVSFKDTSEEVKNFSKTALESFGIAEGSALDMASMFGDMGTSMGLTTKQASNMSTTLVGLAGDLASFKNISLSEATTALSAIFTGETESLKRLGIVITEVNLKQFAMSQNYKKQFKDMTQAEKVQLRYAYVMAQTKNAQGDFARTGGNAANQMRIFTESLKQAAAEFGQILLPLFTKVVKSLNAMLKGFSGLSDGTKQTILVTAGLVAAIGPLLAAYGSILSFLPKVASAFAYLRTSVVGVQLAKLALTLQTQALLAAETLAMAGTQLLAAAQMALTGNIVGATHALNVMKASLMATPWGFIAGAVALATVAYIAFYDEVKKVSAEQLQASRMEKLSSDITKSATSIIVDQRAALEGLLATAKNKLLTDKERKAAIKEINNLSPEFLGNITLEGIETDKTRIAVDKYTEALLRGAKARAAMEKLEQIFKQQIDNEFKAIEAREKLNKQEQEWKKNLTDNLELQKQRNKLTSDSDPLLAKIAKIQKDNSQEEIDFLNKIINENKKYLDLIKTIGEVQQINAGIKAGTIAFYEAEIEKLQKLQKEFVTTSSGYAKLEKQVLSFQKLIDAIKTPKLDLPDFVRPKTPENEEPLQFGLEELKNIQAYYEGQREMFSKNSDEYKAYAERINNTKVQIAAIEGTDDFVNQMTVIKTAVMDLGVVLGETIASFQESLAAGFGEMLGQLITGGTNLQGVFRGLMGIVADFIINLGKALIQVGIASEAFKKAFASPGLAIGVGVAMIALGTAFKSMMTKGLPAYKDGGIVGGSSFYGDKILARVNSGELILNNKQQKNLYGMINPAVSAGDVAIQLMGGFEIEGAKLRLVLDRTDKIKNRLG